MGQKKVTVINAGINGHNVVELIQRLDKDCLSNNPQMVVLMVGTNDMLNEAKLLTTHQYQQYYEELIKAIQEKARLVIMTIPPVNDEYIINRQPPETYKSESPTDKVKAANNAIKQLAERYNCHLIDLYSILENQGGSTRAVDSLFQNEANFGIADGVHPTANGYKVIGNAVYDVLKNIDPQPERIVCFGDSITYGYKTNGEGTINGEPYPAILNMLYNQ